MINRKRKNWIAVLLLLGLLTVLSACRQDAETDGPKVTPDTGRFLTAEVKDTLGRVVFPSEGNGAVFFDPCFIQYKNGDVDAWYTVDGPATGEQWIVYNRFDSETADWSGYRCVLQTQSGTLNAYSVSQPSAIFLNGFYYLAYTGSANSEEGTEGNASSIFVARAKQPEGPYEKWDGSGWSDCPQPVIYYDGPDRAPGAGDVSLVESDGTLYIYYVWNSADANGLPVREVRLAKADAAQEDWPERLQFYGNVCKGLGETENLEIKYSEETGKMIALGRETVSDSDSALVCFEGNTPELLTRVSVVRNGIYNDIFSLGLSGSVNGHLRERTPYRPFIMYAYNSASEDGYTCRIHWVGIRTVLAEHTNMSQGPGYLTDGAYLTSVSGAQNRIMAVFSDWDAKTYVAGQSRNVSLSVMDQTGKISPIPTKRMADVVFSDYDESVLTIENFVLKAKKNGQTRVTVTLDGVQTYFTVTVRDSLDSQSGPVVLRAFRDTVYVSLSERSPVQLRALAETEDGTQWEISRDLTFSDYDETVLHINNDGTVTPVKEGKTNVTITYRQVSSRITLIITS